MKKLAAALLVAAVGLALPLSLHAQAGNNAARIASRKHNTKLSRKQMKARNRAMRKQQKALHKLLRAHKPQHTSEGTTPS